jgi:predicted nucleic acid-binding protein
VIAYLDASVVLRIVLGQTEPLAKWGEIHGGVSSTLLSVECRRTLDLLWHRGVMTDETYASKSVATTTLMRRVDLRPLDEGVLEVAMSPFPTPLATLDAMHLATAMIYRAGQPADERPIVFATHDEQLAKAAAAMHFEVIGAAL